MSYYLDRFAFRDQLIVEKPDPELGIIIVIPCHNENNLVLSLQSILNCNLPKCSVEVITVINASETTSEEIITKNKQSYLEAKSWAQSNNKEKLNFLFIEENSLPKKHAGVGLARKIGMDEAVRRFEFINNLKGIILCFDADSSCDTNYLVEVEKHFNKNVKTPACSIHFEHPIKGDEFSEEVYNGILQYELHLRYYKNGLRYANLPYAFHTIGSSMAVRSEAYQKQNGMNKRKAGEDFYFLQKLIPLGGFSEIKTTKVIPSPRESDRVPFGTGRAITEWLLEDKQEMMSYSPLSFQDLKGLSLCVSEMYHDNMGNIPQSIKDFFETIDFDLNVTNIKKNSTSEIHFEKLFFNWFNAFKVLKYMHYARDNYYPDVALSNAANELLVLLDNKNEESLVDLLAKYRGLDLL